MNSQQFYLINLIIFVGILLYFWLARPKSKAPTKLNLRAYEKNYSTILDEEKLEDQEKRVSVAKDVSSATKLIENAPKLGHARGIFFVYNGHEWEAHEVLGIPRDSNLAIATTHYQNLIKTSDPSTFEFYEAAYSAILKTKS